jgi:predicted nucleotidyltransferase
MQNDSVDIPRGELLKAIAACLPAGAIAVHAAVCGSRSKGIASRDSDYDIKVIVIHERESYLLQRVSPAKRFSTTCDGTEVEGVMVDVLTAFKYILSGNTAIYEAFSGIPILSTQLSDQIERVWYKAYRPEILLRSYQGMLTGQRKRRFAVQLDGSVTTTRKFAMECAYLALKITAIHLEPRSPPPGDLWRLIEATRAPRPARLWIESLANDRAKDKNMCYTTTKSYWQLIENAMALQVEEARERTTGEIHQSHRGELNQLFLSYINDGST